MDKIGTSTNIKRTISKEDFHIKKKFGQNFLVDQNILQKIVSFPSITKETLVIEVGPGLGSLTEHLLKKSKRVLAYEIDNDLIPILGETFKESSLTVIHDDFLNRDIDNDVADLKEVFDKVVVVANLPYYITTPIIMKILEESKIVKELVIMTQLEVAKRITSKPSTKDYNSLSVAIQYKTKAEIVMNVPRTVFIPAPNVDSAIVKLTIIDGLFKKPIDELHFYKLVRASFGQRRKTLVNNLNSQMNLPKEYIIETLESLDFDYRIRAENLSVNDFILLSDNLIK
jgi:16S rRNA (adenine1518-N6/adenine1519-N6)-dimethyltransferase